MKRSHVSCFVHKMTIGAAAYLLAGLCCLLFLWKVTLECLILAIPSAADPSSGSAKVALLTVLACLKTPTPLTFDAAVLILHHLVVRQMPVLQLECLLCA